MTTVKTITPIEAMAVNAIPIYTLSKPHPQRKRADCPLEVSYKNGLRLRMQKEIEAIVAKYEEKVKTL